MQQLWLFFDPMDKQRDSQPLGSGLGSGTAFTDKLQRVALRLVLQFPQTQSQGVCHRPSSPSRLQKEPYVIISTNTFKHGHEDVNTGIVPAGWGSRLGATGSRDRAYGGNPCQLGCLPPCEGNRSTAWKVPCLVL